MNRLALSCDVNSYASPPNSGAPTADTSTPQPAYSLRMKALATTPRATPTATPASMLHQAPAPSIQWPTGSEPATKPAVAAKRPPRPPRKEQSMLTPHVPLMTRIPVAPRKVPPTAPPRTRARDGAGSRSATLGPRDACLRAAGPMARASRGASSDTCAAPSSWGNACDSARAAIGANTIATATIIHPLNGIACTRLPRGTRVHSRIRTVQVQTESRIDTGARRHGAITAVRTA